MLIKALADRARTGEQVPPGYAKKPLGFELHIDEDLRGCSLLSRYVETSENGRKSKLAAPATVIPNLQRSGTKPRPMLGCDTAAFVLGWAKPGADAEERAKAGSKARDKQFAFDQLLGDYVAESGDEITKGFLQWRHAGCPGLEKAIQNLNEFELRRLEFDPVAIRLGNSQFLHDTPSAKSYWSKRSMDSKSSTAEAVCLSCGQFGPVVETLPQMLSGSLIPATSTASVALVSTNFPSASRGASGLGLRSAPVCPSCATLAVQAFNLLAADPKHRWGDRSDETALIWWSTDEGLDFHAIDTPDPGRIQNFLSALHGHSRAPHVDVEEIDRFYALAFSGNVARLVIRQWIDLSLVTAHTNVAAWFEDTGGPRTGHEHPSLTDLAKSAGVMVRSQGKWEESLPDGARESLLRTALTGVAPPRGLLVKAVARASAEVRFLSDDDGITAFIARRRADSRFGLIKLILNRTSQKENPLKQYVDDTRDDPAYLSGRIFAFRESIQHKATGGNLNSTIVDRYFERASANPASVEHALSALERQHLKAIDRKGSKGTAVALDKQVSELLARRSDAPGRLTAEQQAMWLAGYHQQRQDHFNSAAEHADANNTTPEEND